MKGFLLLKLSKASLDMTIIESVEWCEFTSESSMWDDSDIPRHVRLSVSYLRAPCHLQMLIIFLGGLTWRWNWIPLLSGFWNTGLKKTKPIRLVFKKMRLNSLYGGYHIHLFSRIIYLFVHLTSISWYFLCLTVTKMSKTVTTLSCQER